MQFFISDMHFEHKRIIEFERDQFKTVEEHDQYLVDFFKTLAKKLKPTDELYVLGDWGSTDYLWVIDLFNCKTIFLFGNHDKKEKLNLFKNHFDEVHLHPFFITEKIVLSHFPVAVYDDTINIHGHLHGAKLADANHVCASIDVINYKPISDKQLSKVFGKIDNYNRKFLQEPFAADYVFTKPRVDVIMDENNKIDLSGTRVLKKLQEKEKNNE